MVIVLKCRKHGHLTEEQCYYSESKKYIGSFRYRCKQCYEGYNLNKSLDRKKETLEKIKDWKRRNRDKINEQVKQDRKINPEKYKKWQETYHEKFGDLIEEKATARRFKITLEQYHELIESQSNKCAICCEPETRLINGKFCRLCVDHDHKTGKIRGLLCHDCNSALGKFEDDVKRLESAIDYLKKHE